MPDLAWPGMIFNVTKVKKDGNLLKINASDHLLLLLANMDGQWGKECARSETTIDCKFSKTLIYSLKLNGDTSDRTPYPQDKKGGTEK